MSGVFRDNIWKFLNCYRSISCLNLFIVYFSFFVGAPVNVADEDGWSPLYLAAVQGNFKVAEALLQKGEFIFALLILYLLYNDGYSKL